MWAHLSTWSPGSYLGDGVGRTWRDSDPRRKEVDERMRALKSLTDSSKHWLFSVEDCCLDEAKGLANHARRYLWSEVVKLGCWVAGAGAAMQRAKGDGPRRLRRETEKRYRQGLEISFSKSVNQLWRRKGNNWENLVSWDGNIGSVWENSKENRWRLR